jgi:hypothetical protein
MWVMTGLFAAAANAKARFAERDVAVHQRAALAQLAHLPDGPERARTVLDAHRALLDLGPRRETDAAALHDVVNMLGREIGPSPDDDPSANGRAPGA